MSAVCLLVVHREGKEANAWTRKEFPNVPRIGENVRVNDGGLRMFYRVAGVQYTPDEADHHAVLLLEEHLGSRNGVPMDYLKPRG